MSKITEQDRRDLSKALSYANWSALGIIIPFVGWLLAGMSLSFVKTIPITKETKSRIHQIKRAAWLGIIISSIAFAAWGGYYKYQTTQTKKREAQIRQQQEESQKQKQETDNEQARREIRARNGLNNCLGQAYDSYKQGWDAEAKRLGWSDGTLPKANAELWESRYKDAKDECYRQFNAGLFDNYIPPYFNQ